MLSVLLQRFIILCLVGLWLTLSDSVAQTRVRREIPQSLPRSPEEQEKLFRLPPGFQIELIASEPEIPKPINMNFDAAGRLFVSHSTEYPFAPFPGRPARDAIKMILDDDQNGIPETVVTYAEGLSIPIGVTPVHDGVIGLSIPNLYRFSDTDGDGRADRKEAVYGPFGYGDTHGMVSSLTWWVDGWIYGCHSNNNRSRVAGKDGHTIDIKLGNTHRFRPDGSRIEFFTRGQVNPFGISFDLLGNAFNADCHTKPITLLLRGGYYPDVLFKGHDGLGFAPMMMRHSHGSTGLAGIVYYAAENFPESYQGTVFLGNPITGRINHDRFKIHGSSFQAVEQPDFLTCDDPWFRPVDLQLAPDGSLYIADFYSPIIAHYEVPLTHSGRDRSHGRIWRVSYKGSAGQPHTHPPNLTRSSMKELVDFLAHENLGVRTHSVHQLVHRIGLQSVAFIKDRLLDRFSAAQRAYGLWVLFRLDALNAETVTQLAGDSDRLVRVHLMKALAELSGLREGERRILQRALSDEDAFVRRAAVDALGQHPDSVDLHPLIDLWNQTDEKDTHLIHAIRMTLRNILRNTGVPKIIKLTESDSTQYTFRIADICLGIKSAPSAQYLLDTYQQQMIPELRRGEILHHMARYIDLNVASVLFDLLDQFESNAAADRLQAIQQFQTGFQERGGTLPASLIIAAEKLALEILESSDSAMLSSAIGIVSEFQIKQAVPVLKKLAIAPPRRRGVPGGGRPRGGIQPAVFDALIAVDEASATEVFVQLLGNPRTSSGIRWRLEKAIGKLNESESHLALIDQLRVVSGVVETTLVRGLSGSVGGARALLAAIETGILSPRILLDPRVNVNLHYTDLSNLDQRLSELVIDLPPEDEILYQLIDQRKYGFQNTQSNGQRGKEIFTVACAACHRVQGEGGEIGPQLDGIGMRGLDRLLEDVIDPNRNVDLNYRASRVELNNGEVIVARVLSQEGQVMILVDEEAIERRIPLLEIKEHKRLNRSSMPANLIDAFSEQDFYDLINYLLNQRIEPLGK
jgi:putative heme-binding domain-containing protein